MIQLQTLKYLYFHLHSFLYSDPQIIKNLKWNKNQITNSLWFLIDKKCVELSLKKIATLYYFITKSTK